MVFAAGVSSPAAGVSSPAAGGGSPAGGVSPELQPAKKEASVIKDSTDSILIVSFSIK